MMTFVFEVRHPSLHPPQGVVVVTAPDFTTAIQWMAKECPGLEVIRLVGEYPAHLEGKATA